MMQPIWNKQELHLYKLAGGSLKKAKYFSFIKISIKKAKYFGFIKISIQLLFAKRNPSENDVFLYPCLFLWQHVLFQCRQATSNTLKTEYCIFVLHYFLTLFQILLKSQIQNTYHPEN